MEIPGYLKTSREEVSMYSTPEKIRELIEGLRQFNEKVMDRAYLIAERYGADTAYLAFAFVFIYFGLQKPLPVVTPVDSNISLLAYRIGVPTSAAIYFVGFYEIFLGLLFLFRLIRRAFWLFLAHQAVTLMSLILLSKNAFQPPWITFIGQEIPLFLNGYSAFVLKNLVFIACFLLLFRSEYRYDGQKA